MKYATELAFAKDLAYEAGAIMRRYFKAEDIDTTWKADSTPLTVADTKINSLVIERVKETFPYDGVLGEEESFKPERDRIWVCDPIDGTMPFSLDMPISTFLLALVDRSDGQPVVAVIYDPYLDHLYFATKGGGAFLNDIPIKCSKTMKLSRNGVTVFGPPTKGDGVNYKPGQLMDELRKVNARNMSFASGGYTAAKLAEGIFSVVITGSPAQSWDYAAPCLLVQEAGGLATDLAGRSRRYDEAGFGSILAANQGIHDDIMALIKGKA